MYKFSTVIFNLICYRYIKAQFLFIVRCTLISIGSMRSHGVVLLLYFFCKSKTTHMGGSESSVCGRGYACKHCSIQQRRDRSAIVASSFPAAIFGQPQREMMFTQDQWAAQSIFAKHLYLSYTAFRVLTFAGKRASVLGRSRPGTIILSHLRYIFSKILAGYDLRTIFSKRT